MLAIDVSGSMAYTDWKPTRLQAALNAANAFIRRLATAEPGARVAIVSSIDASSDSQAVDSSPFVSVFDLEIRAGALVGGCDRLEFRVRGEQ